MTEQRHDKDNGQLDEYLDGNSPVSDAYRELGQPEPSAALDRAILKAAQDEVSAAGKRSGSMAFWRRWMTPLSTIAAMGLCLAVILQFMVTEPEVLSPNVLRSMRADMSTAPAPQAPGPATDSLDQLMPEEARPELFEMQKQLAAGNEPVASQGTPAAPAQVDSLEDIVVTARKRAPGIAERQQVPQQATAGSSFSAGPGLEEMVVARREPEAGTAKVASADALDAWKAGSRPAADVWIAGIRALHEDGESEWADEELAKMRLQYPAALAYDGKLNEEAPDTDRLSKVSADQAAAIGSETPALSDLPDPDIWAAGIEWLYDEGETERAEVELEKLRRVYPDFEF